jgi:type III secretion protein D
MARKTTRRTKDTAAGEPRLLRVLSGPHFGAEMSLASGRYGIGTAEDCDIVFSDRALAGHHAFLTLSDGAVSIEPGEGSVIVDGAELDHSVALSNFKPVRIGSTVLAIGPGNAPWPEIDLSNLEAEPPSSARNGDDAGADGDQPNDQNAPDQTPEPAANDRSAAATTPAAAAPAAAPAAATLGRVRGGLHGRWQVVAVVAVAAVLVLSALGGFGFYVMNAASDDAVDQTAEKPTSRKRVEKIVEKLGLGGRLTVTGAPAAGGKGVVVQGYVDTETQRRELVSALRALQSGVQIRVWSTALLKASLEDALAGMRLDIAVSEVEDGKVVLTGVLPGSITEEELSQRLRSDVSGITSIDLDVASIAKASSWLRERVAAGGIPASSVSITADGHGLVAHGRLDASLQRTWHDLVSSFGQRYDGRLTLQDDVTFVVAGSDTLPNLVVRAIHLGPPAYITLKNNDKLLVGSRLPNGMTLEAIEPNGMVVLDGNKRRFVAIAKDTGRLAFTPEREVDTPEREVD